MFPRQISHFTACDKTSFYAHSPNNWVGLICKQKTNQNICQVSDQSPFLRKEYNWDEQQLLVLTST